MESQMRNAMGDNHVCVGVYAHPCVGIDRIPNSKESLEAGCLSSTELQDPGGFMGEAVGVDLSQIWDLVGRGSKALTPRWGVRC